MRVEDVPGSDEGNTGWFLDLFGTEKASNVPAIARVGNKRAVSGAHSVVEQYAKGRVFVAEGSNQLWVISVQRQFVERCVKVDETGDNSRGKGYDGLISIPERFQSQLAVIDTL